MGHPSCLMDKSVTSSLPEIVKKQVLFPSLKDKELGMIEREKITKRLITAFQISFKNLDSLPEYVFENRDVENEENKISPIEVAVAEFGAYLKAFPYHLTGEEVLEAYRMASRGELRDFNGKQIEFYPTLQTSQAGKILMAYHEYKVDNKDHTKGILKLQNILKPKPILSENNKEFRLKNWKVLVESVKQNKPCNHAFLFYDFVIKKGGLNCFVKNEKAQIIVWKRKMKEIILIESSKPRSILFNKIEIKHLFNYFNDPNDLIKQEALNAFERLKSIASPQVKNDLVYRWVQKQIKKNHEQIQ